MSKGSDRVIFALDVPDGDAARNWVDRLAGHVGLFKVGLELFVSAGPELVRDIVEKGGKVFLDLKFHDIPNTVASAVRASAGMGAFMLNVHGSAGADAMRRSAEAAKEGAAAAGVKPPRVIAVTALTSASDETLRQTGYGQSPAQLVKTLAALARDSGLDGVVSSPREAADIRALWPDGLIVTPGVRPAGAALDDQLRVATPGGAIRAGSDYLVVGRPIRAADDPVAAAAAISEEVQAALEETSG